MSVVKYKDTRGKEHTWTGKRAADYALEEVCRDLTGSPFTSFQNQMTMATIETNGVKSFFTLFAKVVTLDQARSAADLSNVAQQLAARTEKYGFIECPMCETVFSRKVIDCRRCGHEAEIPEEANKEIRDYIKRPLPGLDDEEGVEDKLHEDRLLNCSPDDDPQKIEVKKNMRRRELEDKVSGKTATPEEAQELLGILQGEEVIDTDAQSLDHEVINTDATVAAVHHTDPETIDPMDAMVGE